MAALGNDATLEAFEKLFGPEFGHGKAFDLGRLRAALDALGAPHKHLPPVIHVAGTNGKGSTIAFLRAIAEAAGLKVHAFTKPHLFRLTERFIVAGETVSNAALLATAERVAKVAPELTQFDAQIAAALMLFSETPADLVLLETGMGGRDDSTNVLERPAISIITPIGIDHQDALGATLADIAAHKAGMLKPGVRAIVARQSEQARAIIEAQASRIGAPLLTQGVEWDCYVNSGRLVVQTETRTLDLPQPALVGAHQVDNAGLACTALMQWRDLPDDAYAAGISAARWPGRLQPLTRGPFSAPIRALGGEVWVDGGHNAHAAAALAQALGALQRKRKAPAIAVIGLRARKDADAFIAAIASAVDEIIAVPLSDTHIAPDEIAACSLKFGTPAQTALSLEAAMQNAAQLPAPRVLICGSFLLAAEALAPEAAEPAQN